MTTTDTRQDCLVLPYLCETEDKAEQFADAIEVLFCPSVSAEVFEDGGKWGVAIVEGKNRITDPINNERIVSAVILFSSFDCNYNRDTGDIECLEQGSLEAIPAAQEALTHRARRQFRIEAELATQSQKLDKILVAVCQGNASALATA